MRWTTDKVKTIRKNLNYERGTKGSYSASISFSIGAITLFPTGGQIIENTLYR